MSRNILDIYKEYKIPHKLSEHMFRVAAVAKLICENLDLPISKDELVTACLLHDMGNIVKFDMSLFPEYFEPEGVEYWQKVKDEFVAKYGSEDHVATRQIVQGLCIDNQIVDIINYIEPASYENVRDGSDVIKKVAIYSDNRVSPQGVVSYAKRVEDAEIRYAHKKAFNEEDWIKTVNAVLDIEKQIFAKCKIKPEDINDMSVASIIEELKNFTI